MAAADRPTAAVILGLVSGVLIIVGGVARMMWAAGPYWGGWRGMMGPGMMGMWMPWFAPAFSAIGLVSGLVILASALTLQSKPEQAQTWGILILVFSVVSLLSVGGFLVGAILGIIAGILALTWRPTKT